MNTIRRAEVAEGGTSLTTANELAIRRAFESAGVEFTNGDQPGVRLTKAATARSLESASWLNPQIAIGKAASGKSAKATKRKR